MDEVAAFQNNFDSLKTSVHSLKNELEDKNQLIHDYKKQLALTLALEKDYQQEIEMLQCNEPTEIKTLKKRLAELEEDITKLKDSFHSDLLHKSEENDSLKMQIDEFTRIRKNNCKSSSAGEIERAVKRIAELKAEINTKQKNLVEIEDSISYIQIQNVSLEQTYNILSNELKDKSQYFTSKSQELTTAKNKLQALQEDVFLKKLELESLKSKPLDERSKGNSLFAEVEDSCQKVNQNLEQTKKNYSRLKQDVTSKMKQLSIMRTQNVELCARLNLVKDLDEDYDRIIQTYKAKVHKWESVIYMYKKQTYEQPKFNATEVPHYAVEFANNTLQTKWASEKKLVEELNNESKKKLQACIEIVNVNNEMRRWRRIAQQLKVKTEKFENIIAEIELYKNLGATSDLEECFNTIERELSEINLNLIVTIDDIIKDETVNDQSKSSVDSDQSVDTKYNSLEGLPVLDVKSDYSLENLQNMESNLTNSRDLIKFSPTNNSNIEDKEEYNMAALVKEEIRNESINITDIKIELEADDNTEELENNSFEIGKEEEEPTNTETVLNACEEKDQSSEIDDCEDKESVSSHGSESDMHEDSESVIEIESTFNDSNNTTQEQSLGILKIESQSTIEDSSVEIVDEFKISQDENIKLISEIKKEELEDNNSIEIVAEYENPQNEVSLSSAFISMNLIDNCLSIPDDTVTTNDNIQEVIETQALDKEDLPCNNPEYLVESIAIKSNNSEKPNSKNVLQQFNSRRYSTPARSSNSIKGGSESKIGNRGIASYHTISQKQNSSICVKSNQKCLTAVKTVPSVAVTAEKCISQSEKKGPKSATSSIPMLARKKLL